MGGLAGSMRIREQQVVIATGEQLSAQTRSSLPPIPIPTALPNLKEFKHGVASPIPSVYRMVKK